MANEKAKTQQTAKVRKLHEGKHVFEPAEEPQNAVRPSQRTSDSSTEGSGSTDSTNDKK